MSSALNYSVHSHQTSLSREHTNYHGIGTMSLNYKVGEVTSTDPAYSAHSINTDY